MRKEGKKTRSEEKIYLTNVSPHTQNNNVRWLLGFYAISILVGHLMSNPVHSYKY